MDAHVRARALVRPSPPKHFSANLALGKPVTAPSEYPDNPASLAVDGDSGTLWNSGSYAPQWIEVDLGAVKAVDELDLVVSQLPDSSTTHRIYGKANEADPYTLLHEFNGFTVDAQVLQYVLPTQQQLRYVKVETTSSASWVAWREIGVYGPGNMSSLDNGLVKVGVDLDRGGVITHVSQSGAGDADNLVNEFDLGREVQQSYYSGGVGPGTACPGFGSEWNPVGAGDCNGNVSSVLAYSNDGRTIYVKSRPLLWAFDNAPCECTFEQWISLARRSVQVRNRLVSARGDKSFYSARWQELPAFYTVGRLGHLYSYTGGAPYTGGPLTEINADLPNAAQFHASEHWAANVDDSGVGLGIVNPGVQEFLGGFWGARGLGGSLDDSTGYIAPVRPEILDWNVAYEYSYALVLGTLGEIRAYAVAHRPDGRPNYRFSSNRQGWTYWNATDTGFPISGALHVRLDLDDPQMIGPDGLWTAKDVPRLYIRAAYHSAQDSAQLFWRAPGTDYTEARSLHFNIVNDGKYHTYAIDVASSQFYIGAIEALRLDPVNRGEPGASVDVAYISWKPDLRSLSVSVEGTGSVQSSPAGISCPPACNARFAETSAVTLTATPAPGFAFDGWTGCDSEDATCEVSIDGDAAVTAKFVPGLHRRSLSLSFRKRYARGRVRVLDGFLPCRDNVRVRIQRRIGRRWKPFASAWTNATGRYTVRVRKGHGVFRARVAVEELDYGHVCRAAKSAARRR
jgi:F5/8 type C domain/Divergent InlB B-repeat domain